MPKIQIYTTNNCPYCVRAKSLLQRKNADFEEIKITSDEMRDDMIKKSGGMRSVPQIFVDDKHIGDCDGIYELDKEGKLNEVLGI
jgi:glutaredoxin 3